MMLYSESDALPPPPPLPPNPITDDYPVRLDIAYPEGGNRFMILVRWFLAIPLSIVLGLAGIPAHLLSVGLWAVPLLLVARALELDLANFGMALVGVPAEWFGRTSDGVTSAITAAVAFWPGWWMLIAITGGLPMWLSDYIAWLQRFRWNMQAYVLFGHGYPPFTGEYGEYPPVTFDVTVPSPRSRWLPLVQWLLSVPHMFALAVLGVAMGASYVGTWWAVLATGRYPRNLFEFQVGYLQWAARVGAYQQLLVDRYPPFSFGRPVSGTVVALSLIFGVLMFAAFVVLIATLAIAFAVAGMEEARLDRFRA